MSKGRIHCLELFAGSARLSQCSALAGMKTGQPVDLRTGFALNNPTGQRNAMTLIIKQEPEIVYMAPVCAPWGNWSEHKDEKKKLQDREKAMPMVNFCAQVARHQLDKGRYFIIEHPDGSKMWFVKAFEDLLSRPSVQWDTFHMCMSEQRDPITSKLYYKPTSLMHNLPKEVMKPIFKKGPAYAGEKAIHEHEALQGKMFGLGNRTALAQAYPY